MGGGRNIAKSHASPLSPICILYSCKTAVFCRTLSIGSARLGSGALIGLGWEGQDRTWPGRHAAAWRGAARRFKSLNKVTVRVSRVTCVIHWREGKGKKERGKKKKERETTQKSVKEHTSGKARRTLQALYCRHSRIPVNVDTGI